MKITGRQVRGALFSTITILVGLSLMVYLIWHLRMLILPVIIGILLAYLFRPLRTAFKYRWMPPAVRTVILFTLISSVLLGGVSFIKSSLPNEKEKLELLVRMKFKFNQKFEKMMEIDPATGKGNDFYNLVSKDINPLRRSLNKALELSPEQVEKFLAFRQPVEGFEPVPEKYYQYYLVNTDQVETAEPAPSTTAVAPDTTPVAEQSLLKTLIGLLSMWVLMPIIFVFFLLDDGSINRFFINIVPNRYFELALTVLEEVDDAIGKYLRGLSMECGLVALTMMVGLVVAGLPFQIALLVGALTGLATTIPMFGPVVGLSLSLTYALIAESTSSFLPFITMDNLFVSVMIVNVIVIALDNAVYQPVVLGSAVNLHPLAVILGIMGGSILFGAAGVLLAIPTIVVSKAIIQHTFRGLKDYRIV